MKLLLLLERSPCALSVSFFTSLPFPVPFSSHLFPVFALCASCVGLIVKGLGVLGLQAFGQQQHVAQLMSWERATGLYRQASTGQQ